MTQDELVARLAELHQELSQTDRIDAETLELLRTLTADVARLSGEQKSLTEAEAEPVASGLKDLLLSFEAEHPQLAVSIGRVADALAAIGI
jgi:hypothetical protein